MATEKNTEKMKALDAVLLQIEKQYGKGSIMRLGDEAGNTEIEVIPTGCLSLDIALGVGGLPRGRIIEIYGPESSGKTTVALHAIAEAQKMGGVAAFIDAEHALDPVYAKKLGVSLEDLYVSQPDTGEQALDIADALVRSSAGVYAETDHMERSIKAQFKYADKIGAKYVAVIGGNELESGVMNVKCMATGESESVAFENASAYFLEK